MMTMHELSRKVGTSRSNAHRHIKKLGKVHREGVWIPHLLTDTNKRCKNNIRFLHSYKTLSPETKSGYSTTMLKRRNNGYLQVKPQFQPKAGLHPRKALLCVWWDSKGVIYFEVLK
jgi:histone-lysine N-methyltransferase SETMAR